jgi:hypothetical protein
LMAKRVKKKEGEGDSKGNPGALEGRDSGF